MKNLCKPYKEFQLSNITQGWSEQHKAFDLARWDKKSYGTILVAMENCIVENIATAENWDNGWEMERGYGVLLRSIANPEVKYSYWHCLPFFPVKKGDTVLQGQPVAQMGNSGFCLSNGVVVLLADRLKPPYKGTHLHMSCPKDTIDRIDYTVHIKIDLMTTIYLILGNMMSFINK
ncbi:MAG: M23 family metallopeptidase [Bacteroidales bacterium]|jgi:hypothetical protein